MRHFTYISTATRTAQIVVRNLSEKLFFNNQASQWALVWSLFLSFALLTMSTNLYAQTVDSDGDGIADSIDLDDDNDGILDTVENVGCINTLITPVSATSSPVYANGATADKTINSTGFTGTGLAALATAPGTLDDSWLLQEPLTSGFIEYTIPLSNVGGVVLWAPDAFNYPGGDAPIKDFTVTLFYGNNQTYTSPMYTTAQPTGSGSLPGAQVFTFPSSFSNVSKVRLNISAGWYDLNENNTTFVSTENISVRINYNMFLGEFRVLCGDQDTDGDGIPDRLDLDSDGDGCADAIEGGASFTTANLVTSTMAGGNSGAGYTGTSTSPVTQNLGNTVGSTGTTLGVPTVAGTGQSIGFSQNGALNACTDTDTDGIPDIEDLDDDNDGILDTIELGCSFNQVVYKTGVLVTKSADVSYTLNAGYTLSNLVDGVDGNVYVARPTGDLTNKPLLTFEFPTPKVLTYLEVGHYSGQYLFSLGTTYKIQASNDNNTWFDLTGTLTYNNAATSTSGGLSSANSNIATFTSNTNSYKYYRIFGLAAAPGNGWATEVYFKESICSASDTDGDGIVNSLDLDSDGDGCPDAIEGGASFTTANLTATKALSGSVSSATATLGVPTIAGTGQTIGYGQNGSINACTDTDTDGIPDMEDLDDDNDGILDTAEQTCAQVEKLGNCTTTNLDQTLGIFTHCTGWNAFDFDPSAAVDRSDFDLYGYTNGPLRFDLQGSYTEPVTGKMVKVINPVTAGASYTYSVNLVSNFLDIEGNKPFLRAINNVDGSIINSIYLNGYGQKDLTFTAPSSSISITLGYDTRVGNNGNRFWEDQGLNSNGQVAQTCTDIDTDGDGTPNRLDLDSDGDGCPDAIEGGATFTAANTTATGALSGSVSSAAATLGVPTSAGTGQSIGISQNSAINGCTDTDGDGVANIDDLDDDNDGILDELENICQDRAVVNKTGVLVSKPATISYVFNGNAISNLLDDDESAVITQPTGTLSNSPWLNFEFPSAKILTYLEVGHDLGRSLFSTTSTYKIQGSSNNSTWVDVTGTLTYNNVATGISGGLAKRNSNIANFPSNTNAYKYYRIYGLTATAGTGWATEIYFKEICTDVDKDNDGIPNRLDLDSDGDGCPDAIEGGASFKTANLVTSTMAGGNSGAGYTGTSTSPVNKNLGNTVGSTATTLGVPTIAGTGQGFGYSQIGTLNFCTDTDNDGISDIEDLDDDNDGILDINEQGCINTTGTTITPIGVGLQGAGSVNTFGFLPTATNQINQNISMNPTDAPIYQTYEFTNTLVNPIIGFAGLDYSRQEWYDEYDNPLNLVTLSISPATVISGNGITRIDNTVTGDGNTSAYGRVQVLGSFKKLKVKYLWAWSTSNNDTHSIAFIQPNSCNETLDTDGDGIPNTLDLDSDGDGCPDAIEGGGSFTAANLSGTGALSGAVSNAAATLGVPTSAGTGQTIGSSQNAGVQDANCPQPCVAGAAAPNLSATSISNVCPATTVNLTSITASNTPANTTLTWHSGTPATTANKITGTAVSAGTYFAAFFDATNNCYSGTSGSATTAVTVTITICCPTITNTTGNNVNPSACGTATGSVKICGLTANASGYTVNYDKNGTAATALTNQTADASGCITITGLTAGAYTNIKISSTACPAGSNALSATLTDPTGPSAPTGLAGVPSSGICVGTSVALSATGTTGATYTWTVSPTGATLASVAGTVSGTTASNTFNSTVAGTYTVSLTQTISGCTSAAATTTITVNATPSTVVPTATSKSNVCPTTTVDLTTLQPAAVSGVTYEWHTVASNPTSGTLVASAAAAASGTYYLYGKSASGCYSAASSAVTATVNACIPCTPVDPGIVSGSAASIKTGNTASFTLTGATAGTTTWAIFPSNGVSPNTGTGTSTGLVTFNIAGEYQVLFSTKNSNTPVGCSEPSFATATGQFTVEAPLSPCAKPSASSVGVSPASAAISEGATASFTMSGGTPNSSVQWVIIPSTGVSPSSGTGTSTGSVTFATKGLYTAVFSIVNLGDGSCAPVQQSSSAPIAVGLSPCSPPTSILVNSSTANQASNIGESVTFTATGGIPGVRTWTVTPATGANPSSGTGNTATITFTNGGIYSVVFTSKNSTIPLGCTQPVNTSASIIHNVICSKPVLTVQNITCSGTGSGYTVTFSSNATVTTNNGTVSGNTVTVSSGNATLTATTSCGEVTSLVVTAPSCPVPATCTQVPSLSVGNALCTGTGTYTVSFSATNGTVTSSAGTVSGNTVINIPVGTNAVLTITPTSAACSGQSITVTSPVSCAAPSCSDGSVGISYSTACNNNGTYNINYTTSIAGTTVTSSANSFANLTGTVTLTVTKPGCSPQSVVVSAPVCVLCSKPVLTVQNITCSGTGSGYTVTFSSNATVTTNNGSISGNTVTVSSGNATLTATTSCGEVTSLVVTAPSCPVPATCTQVPSLSVGNALCTGTGTYTVSFSATNGTVTSSAGTVSGNTVINIPVGTNAVLTITPTSASCSGQSITVTSPVSCAAPSCSDGSVGISYSTVCNNNGTYNINYTTSIAGTNVTSSANSFANLTGTVTLTVTKPGCSPQSVVVSAPVCVLCSKPVLTVQNITCSGTGSGYTVTFSSNATVTTNNGTVSGNTVTVSSGNATLTATTSCGEVTSLVITAPSCPVPAACTQVPNLSVGNALCTGTGTYTVSFSATNGTVTSSAGTVSGNTVINIPVGTNAVLTITPSSTACNSQSITVTSPVSCAAPSCTDGSVGISFSTSCNIGGTYNINYTTSIAGTNVTSSANSFANLTGTVTLTVTKPGCSPQSVVVSAPACVVNTDVKLQLKVFLQGAFFSPSGASDALMRDNLRTLGVIPNTEPYTAMANSRFTKFSDAGGQSIGAGVLTNTGNDAIVDWVFVELRDAANPATILKTRAALVQRDGDVVEASDGITPVTFTGAVGTSYYVSVKHRNHLGAMTATAISMSGTGTIVDFTTMNSAQLWDKGLILSDGTLGSYIGSEQVTLGNGKMGLWAGNARNADNKVKYIGSTPDPASLLSQVISFSNNTGGVYNYDFVTPVYMTGDINMDGKVKYAGTSTDTAYILFNIINKYPNNLVNKSYNFDFMIEQIP
jgi:hypothetical protein